MDGLSVEAGLGWAGVRMRQLLKRRGGLWFYGCQEGSSLKRNYINSFSTHIIFKSIIESHKFNDKFKT
jgi:hypothetical protein